jgi:protein disulfide-isomerase A1
LKGPYAEAATKIKEELKDLDVILAKVDATVEKTVSQEHDVKGFPTLKWFIDGKVVADYSGGRSANEIVNWIKKKTGPAASVIDSADALEKAQKEEIAAYVYVEKEEGGAFDGFMSIAGKTEDVAFYIIKDADLAKKLGMVKAPSVAVSRNFDGFELEHNAAEAKDEDGIAAFLKENKLPAYLFFNQGTSQRIFGSGIEHQIIIAAPADDVKKGSDLIKAIEGAKENRGKVVTVLSDVASSDAAAVVDFFGFKKDSKTPQIAGFLASGGKKYKFPDGEKISSDSLVQFAKNVIAGKAEAMTKSAEIPSEPYDEDVRVVVGKNFEEVVLDPKKFVLLEVYAPWCGHCKKLAPVYSKLGAMFKDSDKVVIAKMDGTENEVGHVDVKGFPTIVYFDAKEGAVAQSYAGGRELEDLKKFVEEKAGVKAAEEKEKHEEL